MRKILSNGALILLSVNVLSACAYLPEFPEPGMGAEHGSSPAYKTGSGFTVSGVLFDSDAAVLQPEAHLLQA